MSDHGMNCPLCSTVTSLLTEVKGRRFFLCGLCRGIMLDPRCFLDREEEKKRYLLHRNDVNDPRYRKFVDPIIQKITSEFSASHSGLDFGAGTAPVITRILSEKGFRVAPYDPFFWNTPELIQGRYDYIACCEVMEHFRNPGKEFRLLRSLLQTPGKLFCMTSLWEDTESFEDWYYKNDPTHVFFYHPQTLEWIREHFDFTSMSINGRLVQFTNHAP